MKLHINIDLNELTTIIENHIKKELNITLQDGQLEIDSSKGITFIGSTDKNTKVETKENKPTVKEELQEEPKEESVSSILGPSEDTESEDNESKDNQGQVNQNEIASLFN